MRILDAAIFKFDGFEESAAKSLNHRANHLVAQTIGVDDGATLERFDQAHDLNGARFFIHCYFRERRYKTALLVTASDSEPLSVPRFLARPAEGFGGSFEHCAHPRIGKILHAENERHGMIFGSLIRNDVGSLDSR